MKLATKLALLASVASLVTAGVVSAGPTLQVPPVMVAQDKLITDAKGHIAGIKVYSNADTIAKAKALGVLLADNAVLTKTTLSLTNGTVTDKAWLRLTGNGTVSWQDNIAAMGNGAIQVIFKAEANKKYMVDIQTAIVGLGSGTIQVKLTNGRGANGPVISTMTQSIASDGHYCVIFQPLGTADLEWVILEPTAGGYGFKQADITPM